tara:strand:- start:229 stop:462 length:234 start_codon:yes stop_codon:yes gene_type:complete
MKTFVYSISDGTSISFGTVVEQETRESWLWYKVDWANRRPSNIYNSPSYDTTTGWHRCDSVKVFNPVDMVAQIKELI